MSLNDIMQPEHVIRIKDDGTVQESVPNHYAPDVYVGADRTHGLSILDHHERQMIEDVRAQGWELLTGWSGQYLYRGPIMHPSELIGGFLEEHIRETPGLYVAVVVNVDSFGDDVAGWAIAYREN